MSGASFSGHPELWVSSLPADRGPEGNFEMWEEAEHVLDGLCTAFERSGLNEAVYTALTDAYNRCIEERRRAMDLLELHKKYSVRGIGGVE